MKICKPSVIHTCILQQDMHCSVITGKCTHCIHTSHPWEAVHIRSYGWGSMLQVVLYGQTFHHMWDYMLSLCRESARYISTEDLSSWPNTMLTLACWVWLYWGTVSNHTSTCTALGQISNWAGLAQNRLVGLGIDSIHTACYNRAMLH